MTGNIWPVFLQNVSAEIIYFALERDFKTRFFKTEVKTTNPTEKRGGFETRN